MTKLADDRFMVVVTDTMGRHSMAHLRRLAAREGRTRVFFHDITNSLCQINIHGPNSRKLLQGLTTTDLSNEAFPFRAAKYLEIGFARVLCVRITYVGELGFELCVKNLCLFVCFLNFSLSGTYRLSRLCRRIVQLSSTPKTTSSALFTQD